MKNYIDNNNKLYQYEDDALNSQIKQGLIEIDNDVFDKLVKAKNDELEFQSKSDGTFVIATSKFDIWNEATEKFITDQEKLNEELKEEKIEQLEIERDLALNNIKVEIDGMVFNARPKDYLTVKFGIDTNETTWTLANKTVGDITTANLQQVMDEGAAQAIVIYNSFKAQLKLL